MVLRATFIIFGLKSIRKQLLNLLYGFLHWKCIIKQLLDSVFVICKTINVSVRVIILAFSSANKSYLDNNCLLYTRKNVQVVTSLQTSCNKSVRKLSTSCVRTACF